jgi:hypothetical protein
MLELGDGVWPLPVGIFLLVVGAYEAMRARKGGRWRTVDGEIIESQVVNRGSSFLPNWQAQVRYRYSVGGARYESARITFAADPEGDIRWRAAAAAEKYPQGMKVKVHVSPEDPAIAVLDPGVPWRSYFNLVLGGLLAAYGIYELAT